MGVDEESLKFMASKEVVKDHVRGRSPAESLDVEMGSYISKITKGI